MNKRNKADSSVFFEHIYKKADFFSLKYSVPTVITSEDNSNHYIKVITSETDIENFSYWIEDEKLTINCIDPAESKDEMYSEYLNSFEKVLEIPVDSDINNIKSKFTNGIFTLTIPKSFCFND